MNCEDCLSILATASVVEIAQSTEVREHSASCEDCSRAFWLISEGEQALALALDDVSSRVPASRTAETALAIVKRRRLGIMFGGAFVVLLVLTLWITWVQVIVPGMRATAEIAAGNQRTETIPLQCLSPDQAGDLISPYVRSNGSAYYPGKTPLKIITVRATPEELRAVKTLLGQYDKPGGAACAIQNGADVRVP